MLFHKQEHLVTKGDPNPKGSCYPTVLACLLDRELHRVPYFHLFYWSQEEKDNFCKVFINKYADGDCDKADGGNENGRNYRHYLSIALNLWVLTLDTWLASQGYTIERIPKKEYKTWLKKNKDIPYMVSGTSSRDVGHIVIYKNGKLFHDPHPSNEGLVKLDAEPYEILKKI